MHLDKNQKVFDNFEVPDPVRINKAVNFVRNYFKTVKGLTVLDCGVVKGGFADVLSKDNAECYGIDTNPRNLQGIDIVKADLNNGLPNFDKEFDVVFAGELIEHLYDDVKFIKQSYEILKPDGLLVLTVPNLVFIANRFLMLCGKMPKFSCEPFHYHCYTKKNLQYLLEKNGFKVIKFSASHILFSTRRNKFGIIFEVLGDLFPSLGAHLIVIAVKRS